MSVWSEQRCPSRGKGDSYPHFELTAMCSHLEWGQDIPWSPNLAWPGGIHWTQGRQVLLTSRTCCWEWAKELFPPSTTTTMLYRWSRAASRALPVYAAWKSDPCCLKHIDFHMQTHLCLTSDGGCLESHYGFITAHSIWNWLRIPLQPSKRLLIS